MEKQLLGFCLGNRSNYELVMSFIDPRLSTYSKEFQVVLGKIGEYYNRDPSAINVVPEVLCAQLAETIRSEKHLAKFNELITSSVSTISSEANVRAVILLAKQQEVGDKLAQALVSGVNSGKNIDELMSELNSLRAMTSLDDIADGGLRVHSSVDLAALVTQESDPSSLIKVYPGDLNDKLDGGAKRGHHIILYGRPESGKTATAITISSGFLTQKLKVLYFINEDRDEDIILRHVYCLSGMDKWAVRSDTDLAQAKAEANGFTGLTVIGCSPGSPAQIDEKVEELSPDCVIVDQLRNLQVKADNRVNQLEYAATSVRNIFKKRNVLGVSVTQAGDSADGKAILDMGDVDYSNTGIPSQADVMIGVGVDPTLEAEGKRMLSLPKNKVSGSHVHFPVALVPQLSRVKNI